MKKRPLSNLLKSLKLQRFNSKHNNKSVKKSGLFDEEWYLANYPDVAQAGIDPFFHYMTMGWKEGRNPSTKFSGKSYLQLNQDVAKAQINPLEHYVMNGKKEGRAISPSSRAKKVEQKDSNQQSPESIEVVDTFTKAKNDKRHENHSLLAQGWLQYLPFLQPRFSIVMATYNRAFCLRESLDAILNQNYKNFELILVDDGSSDSTVELIQSEYARFLENGQLKFIPLEKNVGVCKARNIGLAASQYEWIAYADSDNMVHQDFFSVFSNAILLHPSYKTFYGVLNFIHQKRSFNVPFSYQRLMVGNFIDLGVFVHHRSLYESLGGFDENLKRLVDWDLIIRYTKDHLPYFCKNCVLLYNDDEQIERISNKESIELALSQVRSKHANTHQAAKVTTIITTYNHQDYIAQAIESAIAQECPFEHEILLADDASTDGTAAIMQDYADRYPGLIRNISSTQNRGISGNMKHCFAEATGDFIAVLEGDDYWNNPKKLEHQLKFLLEHPECSMVFSRTKTLKNDKFGLIKQQDKVPEIMTGLEFTQIAMNLVANFSSCMFRTELMKNLPEGLYERRLSEVVLIYHLDRFGKIGFIKHPMSVYRLHDNGVWSGSDDVKKYESALFIRKHAYQVSRRRNRKAIGKEIQRYEQLLAKAKLAQGKL